jgi:hypothetical protein
MRESRVREIVREEVRKALKESGVSLNESAPKRGDKVDTPHGIGHVLSLSHPNVRIQLASGAVVSVNRSRCVVKN